MVFQKILPVKCISFISFDHIFVHVVLMKHLAGAPSAKVVCIWSLVPNNLYLYDITHLKFYVQD